MRRQQQRRLAKRVSRATANASLEAMRSGLAKSLHALIADLRENKEPAFEAQAVAHLVESCAESALAMIAAASVATPAPSHAARESAANAVQPTQPDEVRDALLTSLHLIVDSARAGRRDLDVDCRRLAETFAQCFRDAVAGAYLRMSVAVEQRLGLESGAAN